MVTIEVIGATEEELQELYNFLNDCDAEWEQTENEEGNIIIEIEDMLKADLQDFYELANDIGMDWERITY